MSVRLFNFHVSKYAKVALLEPTFLAGICMDSVVRLTRRFSKPSKIFEDEEKSSQVFFNMSYNE